MYIQNMYKYRENNVVKVSAILPEGAELLETLPILTAEDGYVLKRISDEEVVGTTIWLKNDDSQENYVEILDEEQQD